MSPLVVFIGMPGAGKSTVGRAVAHLLNVPFADSDSLIIQRTGHSIPEVIEQFGETGFRTIEADVIAKALRDFGGVLSLGGGSVISTDTQRALSGHRVILIDADDAVLAERIAHSHTARPLLRDDPRSGIDRLRSERDTLYRRLATDVVYSSAGPVAEVAQEVLRLLRGAYTPIHVGGEDGYTVHIGRQLRYRITNATAGAPAALIVHAPEAPLRRYAQQVASDLQRAGTTAHLFELPRAEAAKDISTVQAVWDFAGAQQLGRDAVLIAIGGGATTDVGGFIAATWLRGIPLINVSTTLLGMVDAAVGGKTGINTSHGKNLVGSFYPPRSVLCDLDVLASVPREEIRSGLAEVVKCGFIRDRGILELVAQHGQGVLDVGPDGPLQELVARSVAVKSAVVSADLKESGLREILNYGHTLAHAIELHEHYQRRHGEAVAIGCVFAAALAEALKIAPEGFTDLHRSAFATVGLPVSYSGVSRKELLHAMYSDKKVRGGHLRFVVLKEIGEPSVVTDPPREALAKAFAAVGL
ncbi:MAG: 3-dehydroquinate synthase [Actinomycetaceae bacterium]|nr:3-dehydroquinate synthase [Arcanobacterium sp.]MDD7686431.1 3-dehydroquinate synthase [Actinomycetaceae bacterium]MDY5272711.1 3-dehydroquinate synthase [Arcanobacterium sp.]